MLNQRPIKTLIPAEYRCFSCNREVKMYHDNEVADDAGFADIKFHYGSCLDQCHGMEGRREGLLDKDPLHQMLSCDIIEALICDSCFRKKFHLCIGYIRPDVAKPEKQVEQNETWKHLAQWFSSAEFATAMAKLHAEAADEEELERLTGHYEI